MDMDTYLQSVGAQGGPQGNYATAMETLRRLLGQGRGASTPGVAVPRTPDPIGPVQQGGDLPPPPPNAPPNGMPPPGAIPTPPPLPEMRADNAPDLGGAPPGLPPGAPPMGGPPPGSLQPMGGPPPADAPPSPLQAAATAPTQNALVGALSKDDASSPEAQAMKTIQGLLAQGQNTEQGKWLALARAGFGMAASKNPTFLGALGEGGIAGTAELDNQAKQQREALLSAGSLANTNLQRRSMEQHYRDNAAYQQGSLGLQKDQQGIMAAHYAATERQGAATLGQQAQDRAALREVQMAAQVPQEIRIAQQIQDEQRAAGEKVESKDAIISRLRQDRQRGSMVPMIDQETGQNAVFNRRTGTWTDGNGEEVAAPTDFVTPRGTKPPPDPATSERHMAAQIGIVVKDLLANNPGLSRAAAESRAVAIMQDRLAAAERLGQRAPAPGAALPLQVLKNDKGELIFLNPKTNAWEPYNGL